MFRLYSITIIVSVLFSISFDLFAQEDESLEEIQLDSILISTSRIPLNQQELGRNISVIEGKEVSQLPVNSIDELLRYLPGFEAQSRNSFGVQADFVIRGSTFNQVLVIVDGVRLNDPLTGHFNSYIPISPSEIERIEVLRGPASSVYGADAVGGVVHIVTKTFSGNRNETSGQFEARYGEYNLRSFNLGGYYADNQEKFDFSAGIQSNVSDGQELPTGLKNYFKVHNISASVGYRFSEDWKLSGRVGVADRDFNAQYFYTRSPLDKANEQVRNLWSQVRLAKTTEKKSMDFNVSFKQTSDEFEFSPDFPSVSSHTTRFFIFQFNRSCILSQDWKIGWGVQGDNRSIESNDRGNHDDWHAGAYAILNYSGVRNLNLNLSLRGDYDQNYDFEFTPQLNVNYAMGKFLLRGSAGRGIRAADYTERFISNNLPGPLTPGRNIGNPDLIAETSWTYEAGFDFFPWSGVKFLATVFGRTSDNLIDYVITNSNDIPNNSNLEPDAEYFYATNIESATTSGFETEIWINRSYNSGKIRSSISLGYTYLNTTSSSGEVSKYISNHARGLFTSNLNLHLGRFDIGINGLYKLRNEEMAAAINENLENAYTVWNLKAGFRVIGNWKINLEVLNIFDEEYSDILGARMPSRWFSGGFSWRY